jgi:uncharacterized DUF497 family protein
MAYWWDAANLRKVAAHEVTPEEAEEVLEDPLAVPVLAYAAADGTPREAVVGMTDAGRLVVVVWETRPDVADPDAEPWTVVVTAYVPTAYQRRQYGRR